MRRALLLAVVATVGCGGREPAPLAPVALKVADEDKKQTSPTQGGKKPAAEPGPTGPATLADVARVLDLRTLKRPEGAEVNEATIREVRLAVAGKLDDLAEFYRRQLIDLGWTEDKSPVADLDPAKYVFARFDRSGFRVAISVNVSQTPGRVDVQVTNFGNVDVRKLSRLADAKPKLEHWHYISYATASKPEEAIAFCRKELTATGWKEYRMGSAKFHAKEGRYLLGFAQGAMDLFYNIKGTKDGPTEVTCSVSIKNRPPAPTGEMPEAIKFAEGKATIDLNRFPKLPGALAGASTSAMTAYQAPGNLRTAAEFYRQALTTAGWVEQETTNTYEASAHLLFLKNGSLLSCTLHKFDPTGNLSVKVENHGNIDVRRLPRLDDAAVGDHEVPGDVRYETETPAAASVEFFRNTLAKMGWKESKGESKNYPSGARLLVFQQNATELKIDIDDNSVRIRSHLFGEFIPRPASAEVATRLLDLRRMPRLKEVKKPAEDPFNLEYTSTATLAEVESFHRKDLSKRGWREQAGLGKDVLRFVKDLFVVHLAIGGKDGEVTVAVRNRGDVDVGKLPRFDDGEFDPRSLPEDGRYTTMQPPDQVLAFYRAELGNLGWKDSGEKGLILLHGPMRLLIEATADAGKTTVRLRTELTK